jgi:arsenate reductase
MNEASKLALDSSSPFLQTVLEVCCAFSASCENGSMTEDTVEWALFVAESDRLHAVRKVTSHFPGIGENFDLFCIFVTKHRTSASIARFIHNLQIRAPSAIMFSSRLRTAHLRMARTMGSAGLPQSRPLSIVIYHNPECGNSRNALAMIQSAGYDPTVIEYIKEGWTKPQLLGLFAAAGLNPRTALRASKSPAKELGLLEEGVSQEEILNRMVEFPVLVNRPIVCTVKGVRLCRPSHTVLDVLEKQPKGPVYKEDGEMVIDEQGKRVS